MSLLRSVRTPAPVELLVAAVVAGAAVTAAASLGGAVDAVRAHPETFAALLLVTLVLQVLTVDIYGRGSISVAGVGLLATGFTLGVGAAVAVALSMGCLHTIRQRPRAYKALFNMGAFVLSGAAAAGYYDVVGEMGSRWLAPLALACVSGAIFTVVNFGLLTAAMAFAEQLPFAAVWRERFRWLTPHYIAFGPLAFALSTAYAKLGLAGLLAFALPPALMLYSVRQYLDRTRASVTAIRLANEELLEANDALQVLADKVRRTHRDTIAALSRSMEAKDHYTGGHTERVAILALALAKRLGYTGDGLAAVEIGALLHDIGKIAIPERILHKPGPLNDEEWALMKEHPVVSESILSAVELHPFVCQIARWSHERIDGNGYPDGLAGDEIPLPARIVLVADAFDALTTDRPYRAGRSTAAALHEIGLCSGTQFCPTVVAALDSIHREEPGVLATSAALVAAA